ncbi:hypothetical protein roselon_02541 [Roseibacterium elongatum DSM 19469]|uniref:DUF2849 domain-containing protein n=1 Tax=Roseicyclus elongatus DSM 19469 TaxID=1294273 RepID=W8SQP3_9RHOB|nr:DUF2849 domain-containing protein [Roseibacterium elongatum]AHM04860.1 hypothetical protein roselon_02541 [Roseibacterium elongatum DSM 19469]
MLTANDLLLGDAVWLAPDGSWTRQMSDALLIEDPGSADLHLLDAEARGHEVVGPYLADAHPGAQGPEPSHFREAFRGRGPSNRPHGKQEIA